MGKVTGFLEIEREQPTRRKAEERVKDWFEIYEPFPEEKQREQGARCMDCGVPFCHTGCPVNNLIPDWNDLVYNGRWENAIRRLHATNNFPEFTGRICPAPCEAACVLVHQKNKFNLSGGLIAFHINMIFHGNALGRLGVEGGHRGRGFDPFLFQFFDMPFNRRLIPARITAQDGPFFFQGDLLLALFFFQNK